MTDLSLYLLARKRSLFLIFCLFITGLTAQDRKSVAQSGSDKPEEIAKQMGQLQKLVDSTMSIDLPQARQYALQALDLAEKSGQATLRAQAYLLAGKTWVELTSYDSARLFLDAAQSEYEALKDPQALGEVTYLRGVINSNIRAYSEASKHYFEALEIWEKANYQLGIAKAYGGISDVYSMQSDYNESIDYGNQAIAIFKELGATMLQAKLHDDMAYNYLFLGAYEEALNQVNQAVDLMGDEESKPLELARVYNTRGNILKNMDRYDEALVDYQNNLALCEKGASQRGIMVSTANIGHTLLLKKEYKNALPFTLDAIKMMIDMGDSRNLWENYMHASNIYAGLGDFENANRYTWLYNEEMERLYEEELDQLGSELSQKYETGKREATIVLQRQQISQQRLIQWLIGGVALLLSFVLLLLYRVYRQKQKTNAQLAVANSQLEKKNAENELLLKEIHHRVKNNLQTISSLLNLQSASIEDSNALEAVKESQNRVRSMALIHQKLYQGDNLAAVEMKDYLSTMGEAMKEAFGERARHVSLEVSMDELELDVDTAIPLGLIVNELLTNSLKYAFPDTKEGKIQLSLVPETGGELCLKVADNGVGFSGNPKDTNPAGTGFGSRLVQLLTMQLGGKLEQANEEGLATIIRFKPLSNVA